MKGRRTKTTKAQPPKHTDLSEPPDWLSDHGKSVWRSTITDLEREGRPLGCLNYQTLTGFCDAAGLVKECAETLARDGMTIDGGREGLKRHPAVTTRISALNALRAYAIELGLTPGSAARVPSAKKEDRNEFADLLNS
jgi:P27 family predicted phage terminase small subunit